MHDHTAGFLNTAARLKTAPASERGAVVAAVRACQLPDALDVFVVVEHIRFVGIDMPFGHAGDLRRQINPADDNRA